MVLTKKSHAYQRLSKSTRLFRKAKLSFCSRSFRGSGGFCFCSGLGSLFSFDLGESLRTELGLLGLFRTGSCNLAFDGLALASFVEQVGDAGALQERANGVRGLCTGQEPLEGLFLVELDFCSLGVRVVETDLFDEAIIASLAAVDNDDAVDRVVTLTKARKTDSGCYFNLFYVLNESGKTGFYCFDSKYSNKILCVKDGIVKFFRSLHIN